MDKSKIFINLTKCTEEEQKHIFSLLPERKEHLQYRIDKYNTLLYLDNETGLWWVNGDTIPKNKAELTYPDFIKLFEGGEGEKSDLEVWLNRQIEKCQELDMPREEWAYIQVLKKIKSNQ